MGTCKGVHNFCGQSSLLEILGHPVFRELHVESRCSCVLVFGVSLRFFGSPNIGAHRVSAEKQLTMPPQKGSKKNVPTETNQEEHHYDEDNIISHTPEPSHITDQE
jgi:hypothetical protein